MLERQLDDYGPVQRQRRNDRVAAIFRVAALEAVAHRRDVQHGEAVLEREVLDVGSALRRSPRYSTRHRIAARNPRGHDDVAAVRFLKQQDELIDGLSAGELAAPQPPNHLVDVAATDVQIPRENSEPIERRFPVMSAFSRTVLGRMRIKHHRSNRLAPPRQLGAVTLRGGDDPPNRCLGLGNDLTTGGEPGRIESRRQVVRTTCRREDYQR